MGIFAKLFGKKSARPPAKQIASEPSPTEGDLIRVYDAYGRELHITKQEWRDKVLLGNLEKAKDNPDDLYGMIAGALTDGFVQDVVPFAEHLHRIDPIPARGATLLGVVYMELGRLNDAERVFQTHIQRHGEDGVLLTNLAKVHWRRGETAKGDATLWHALELDPNQDNGVVCYEANWREKDGEAGSVEALRRLAALPGSWRARLWLARKALEQERLDEALRLYDEALAVAPRPVPVDLLMQMSGDLGNHGHLVELLKLTNPHFELEHHGLQVGNNLIKANLELGRLDHARAVLDQLYSLKRPDYQQTLSYWDTEIAKARINQQSADMPSAPALTMLSFQGPIWLPKSSPACELFLRKEADAVVVCFLGASADKGETGEPHLQLSDALGRVTRALSLFLCEQFYMRTNGIGVVLQPFICGSGGGLVLGGKPWEDEVATEQARNCNPQGDYAVITHLSATPEPFVVTLRLVRTIDGSVLDTTTVPVDLAQPERAFTDLAEQFLTFAGRHTQITRLSRPPIYDVPEGASFADYQLRLEQALAVRCADSDGSQSSFLSGEREIVLGNLQLCLNEPHNAVTRLLLTRILWHMKKVRPQVVEELRDKIELLQKEKPLPPPANAVVERLLREVFSR